MLKVCCLLLAVLTGARVAAAQEASIGEPARLFTDQVLTPRFDWYRPDLAAHRVRQVRRTFAPGLAGEVLGLPHPALKLASKQPVYETLRYDELGYLQRYEFRLADAHGVWQTLANEFSYDAQHQLRRIVVSGSPALTVVEDPIARSLYEFGRRRRPLVPGRLGLTPGGFWASPSRWQLNAVLGGADVAGRPLPPQAVVTLATTDTHDNGIPMTEAWTDTLLLDPQRNWQLALPLPLRGLADSTWLTDPDRWWQLRVPAAPAGSLRVQHLPLWHRYSESAGAVEYMEPLFYATSFFGPDGRLLLAREPNYGGVWRYRYDAQGQPWQTEAYFLHLPNQHYRDTLCFGSVNDVSLLPDCEQRLRQPRPLPDGSQAVREFCWRQELRYTLSRQGLPRRATLRTTLPRYTTAASFNWTLSPFQKRHDNHGLPHKKKNWRRIQALLRQAEQFRQQGCVPMQLSTRDTPAIRFRYEFFR